jgi:site-specific DNA-methyltransferase (adenine-specific)
MKELPANSIDMVLCDLPYGMTARNKWDKIISPDELWPLYSKVCKPNAAIVLFAAQPFASIMVSSNPKDFRYDWIWDKNKSTGFLNAKKMPLRKHEHLLVFYRKMPTYNPQKTTGHSPVHKFVKNTSDGNNYGKTKLGVTGGGSTERYPSSILRFPVINNDDPEKFHPTQKPVELCEYLIKSYTNEGDTVLDNTMGSGSTGVAAIRTGRNFVGIEQDKKYFAKAFKRINNEMLRLVKGSEQRKQALASGMKPVKARS